MQSKSTTRKKKTPANQSGAHQATPDAIETEIRRRVEEEAGRIRAEADAPYQCIAARDGRSAFTTLSEQEVRQAATDLGANQLGARAVSLFIALLEHVGALAFAKRFGDVSFSIIEIREALFAEDSDAQMVGLNTMRETVRDSLARSIQMRLANEAEELANGLRAIETRKLETLHGELKRR